MKKSNRETNIKEWIDKGAYITDKGALPPFEFIYYIEQIATKFLQNESKKTTGQEKVVEPLGDKGMLYLMIYLFKKLDKKIDDVWKIRKKSTQKSIKKRK